MTGWAGTKERSPERAGTCGDRGNVGLALLQCGAPAALWKSQPIGGEDSMAGSLGKLHPHPTASSTLHANLRGSPAQPLQ